VASKPGIINVIANDKGFIPGSVDVKKGAATQLVFMRTTDDTCAKQVVFPELKITKDLPLNEKVVFDVPVADARTLTFQCGMGMFKGKVVIQ
jgi:plastocyanin domain-containing protein